MGVWNSPGRVRLAPPVHSVEYEVFVDPRL